MQFPIRVILDYNYASVIYFPLYNTNFTSYQFALLDHYELNYESIIGVFKATENT